MGKLKAAAWNILFSAGDMMNCGAAWCEASPSPISSSLPELQWGFRSITRFSYDYELIIKVKGFFFLS